MGKKIISVIVPVYNTEKYLEKCIKSILDQTYPYFELILVNDGSTDESETICSEYKKKDSRIRYYFQRNQGAGAARNLGIDKSMGDYITFVDSDDWVDNDLLEWMIKSIEEHDILQIGNHVYSADGNIIRGDENNASIQGIRDGYELNKLLLEGKYSSGGVPWAKLYKKELWNSLRFPEINRFEDVAILYLVYWKAKSIKIESVAKYCYRSQRENSIMHSKYSLQWLEVLDIEKQRIMFFKEQNQRELYVLSRFCYCDQIINNIKKIKRNLPDESLELKELKKLFKKEFQEICLEQGYIIKKIKMLIKWIMLRERYCLK